VGCLLADDACVLRSTPGGPGEGNPAMKNVSKSWLRIFIHEFHRPGKTRNLLQRFKMPGKAFAGLQEIRFFKFIKKDLFDPPLGTDADIGPLPIHGWRKKT
jgi:hypothetical protein